MSFKRNVVFVLLTWVVFPLGLLHSQNEKSMVLATIGGDVLTTDEFLSSFQRNNKLNEATTADLRDYLDRYINFKLKVKEGKAQKIDTAKSFVMEYNSYRDQSAQQYMIDKRVSDHLLKEAEDRVKYYLWASHLLVKCPSDALPKDTLIAYNKALTIRDKILSGMPFEEAARVYSDDPSARDTTLPNHSKRRGNRGDLGYFTAFQLVYPFECGAYQTEIGKVSMPTRTSFGYHLIHVKDKIPALLTVSAAQIFFADSLAADGQMSETVKDKIKKVQEALARGISFDSLVRDFSEDKASAAKGGVMEPFSPNRRAGNYVHALVHLQPGEISKPVASTLGWHILQLVELKPAELTPDMLSELHYRVSRDSRSHLSRESLANRLKKEYRYKEAGKKEAIRFFVKELSPASFHSDKIDFTELSGIKKLKPMFSFANKQIEATDFAKYLTRYRGYPITTSMNAFINECYRFFVEDKILEYEKEHLEDKYPEYKQLLSDYHDGLILYDISLKNVWNKAILDSTGLEAHYEKIKQNYPEENTNPVTYKSLDEIRSIVITDYQNFLEDEWVRNLRTKYPVVIREEVFSSILKP
ncbi:MAG: peptidylprolyl isomerase [Bacteroidales bacterium]|jgi:peptidyl-prolyl cis-trans isomerase SurA|nr:peptidylprolyl isomerase [Bacteroidales bacterium]